MGACGTESKLAVLVERVGAKGGEILMRGDDQRLGIARVKGDKPAFGPVLDGSEICRHRVGNRLAQRDRRHDRPEGAVVCKDVELVLNDVKQVIDEYKEEQRGKDAALGYTCIDGQELRAYTVDHNTLSAARQKTAQPSKERATHAEGLELVQKAIMPYTIKRLADVERHNTDFLPRTQSVGPALGHGGEQIEGLVATAKTELVWVQFRAKETLEPVIDEVFKDLAHDQEQGNGPVIPRHTLGLLLVQGNNIDNLPQFWKNSSLERESENENAASDHKSVQSLVRFQSALPFRCDYLAIILQLSQRCVNK